MSIESRRPQVRFGIFEVDFAAGELRREGRRVKLHDKAFQLLIALLDRPGELVTRQELQRHLWPADTFVDFDNNLNNAISRLREALGDEADNPRFIETMPRRGYRFIAPVVQPVPEPALQPLPVAGDVEPMAPLTPASTLGDDAHTLPNTRRLVGVFGFAAVVVTAVLLLGASRWWVSDPEPTPARPVQSMAVLPLLDLSVSRGVDEEYFADGLTEALIMELSRLTSLRVISRTSAMHYKGTAKKIPEIAKELGVDALVEGSIVREGNRVRVTVQLISAATDTHLWSDTFDREAGSLLTLQRDVATAIAREIRTTVTPEPNGRPALRAELTDVYLRGRHLLNQRTEAELRQGLAMFEQIVDRQPDYAPAHVGVAAAWEALAGWGEFVTPAVGFPKVKTAARRALELDPTLAEAHTRLALATEILDLALPAAEAGYQRAIELEPSSALAYQRYSNQLARTRRPEQALEMATRAQQLDPFEMEVNVQYAVRLNDLGRQEEAVRHLRQTADLDPTYYDTWVHLSYVYATMKRPDDQIAAALKGVELSNRAPHAVHALARAYASNGREAEALKLAEELGRHDAGRSALELARLYFSVRQPARGLFWLQQACVERSVGMAYFHLGYTNRVFDPVRNDERFKQVLACAGIETKP